jgi:hypothetical protein
MRLIGQMLVEFLQSCGIFLLSSMGLYLPQSIKRGDNGVLEWVKGNVWKETKAEGSASSETLVTRLDRIR